jgi:multicomponent Na+:H+ antiporter subunit D
VPFAVAVPSGTVLGLLVVFFGLGVFGIVATRCERSYALTAGAVVHAAAGLLVVFAADLITLLIGWELLTFSAYFIIRARSTQLPHTGGSNAERASFWYIAAQISAAALFFVAMAVHAAETGSLAVAPLCREAQPVMFAAILIKTAMLPFHGWLVGGYPQASPVASILLSVYATKVGVYTAARVLAWTPYTVPILSYVGAVVAVAAVLLALLQRSARRLLSYHIISQVGYMLVGVGLAGVTARADAGVTAGLFHAINHIIYKALLFTVVATVMHRLGHDDLRRMGGLWRRMPLVCVCGVVGAAAISGVPFTSGYVSKELLKAASDPLPGYLLAVATVGTALSFMKFVYLIFLRPSRAVVDHEASADPPVRTGMVVLAVLSVLIGIVPTAVPGVPAHAYYGWPALRAGIWPLALALVLWMLLKGLLVGGHPRRRVPTPLRTIVMVGIRPILLRLRGAHRLNPQVSIGIAVSAAIVATFLLVILA